MKRLLRGALAVLMVLGIFRAASQGLIIRQTDPGVVQASIPPAARPEELPMPEPPPEAIPPPEPLEPLPEEASALADADLEAMRAVNGDVVGWIAIPGTEVSYPLLHKGDDIDNEYYMHHGWDGQENKAGSILLECENDISLENFNTLIYGHRMENGSMFGSLKHYSSQEYWQEHPSIYVLLYGGGAYRYDIFSAQEALTGTVIYELDYTGREEEFVRFCLDHSVIDTGVEPDPEDRFLTLVTCTGKDYTARWAVHAVLAQEYEMPEAG